MLNDVDNDAVDLRVQTQTTTTAMAAAASWWVFRALVDRGGSNHKAVQLHIINYTSLRTHTIGQPLQQQPAAGVRWRWRWWLPPSCCHNSYRSHKYTYAHTQPCVVQHIKLHPAEREEVPA